jgi:hypothetical protein
LAIIHQKALIMRKLIILLALAGLPVAGYSPQTLPQQTEMLTHEIKKQIFIEGINERPLTPELLMDALRYADIIEPEIVYKQAIIETGWFSSDLCLNANNLFGMRLAKVRPTLAIGEYEYHAKYEHWWDSVMDYKLFQDWYIKAGYSLDEYYLFLFAVGYATDKGYINKLKSVKDVV